MAKQKPGESALKHYNPGVEEPRLQKFWEGLGICTFTYDPGKQTYSIDTPPPTVSGRMHIGHAFSYAQGDFVARFHRMRGRNVFYPFGTDDNGLPTERLIEKKHNVRAQYMDRDEFIKLCNETLREIKPEFVSDWKRLAISCDFENSYSTIDPHCIATSQKSFIDLYKKGRIYQEDAPVSWCTQCQTAIAQAEFENIEMASHFNDIIFKVGGKELVIATTRPELLCACVAIIAHPSDKRYKGLIGKFATVPLFGHEVPIIADEKADPEKGTGIVMCCTFGDKTDIEWWRTHDLALKIAIERNGKMNGRAGKYEGMSVKECRKAIIEDLKEAGLLLKQEPILHAVNVHERCGTDIEFLKTKQWFIKVLDKKQELIDAADRITWYPEHMKVRYVHWVENLNWDWCISRQRFFGVPFPVWHCKRCGMVTLADEESLPVDPIKDKPRQPCGCGSKELEPETDVMDTWATSSVTPQIALDWVRQQDRFLDMFPMTVRFQAHDIIRTWAFYTIVKAIFNNNDVPWKNIMIAGHALDPKGKKMSKSKGNVVDPNKMMDLYCADALRYWAATSNLGDDLPFQEKELTAGMKTITKLWNASRFCAMHLQDFDGKRPIGLHPTDKWVLSRLHRIIKRSTDTFEAYEYSKTKLEVDKFFWHVFCDQYLELVKGRLYAPEDFGGLDARRSAQYALSATLLSILKLFAPLLPHICEAVFQEYFAKTQGEESVHLSPWPEYDERFIDETAQKYGDIVVEIVNLVRKAKSERSLSLNAPVNVIVISCSDEDWHGLSGHLDDLQAVTKAKTVVQGDADQKCESFDVKVRIELSGQE